MEWILENSGLENGEMKPRKCGERVDEENRKWICGGTKWKSK